MKAWTVDRNLNSDAFKAVQRNFYVDNYLKSTLTVEEAIANARDVRELLSKGGFRLTIWTSNNTEVREERVERVKGVKEERAKGVKELDLTKYVTLPVERALGVKWCIDSDHLGFSITVKQRPATRRGILSIVSSVYDSLGLIAPVILLAKLILQDLCRQKLGWDNKIPQAILTRWQKMARTTLYVIRL